MKMKQYRKHMPITDIKELPLFPTPYPGECFYSVLCRYHIRSGNATDAFSVKQLFGYNASLASTVLSPYHLDAVKYWFPSSVGISAETLLEQHTAFPIYTFTATSFENERIKNCVFDKESFRTIPTWIQPKLIHPSKHLRVCPECAAAQRRLYGEEYWQIFPQLEGVEYCPVHKVRIKTSNVSVKDTAHHFFPASEVLHNSQPLKDSDIPGSQMWEALFSDERELFIKMSEGMSWLFHNSKQHEDYLCITKIYHYLLGSPNKTFFWEIKLQHLRSLLSAYQQNDLLYRYMTKSKQENSLSNSFWIYSMPIYVHLILMITLCGSPKAFFDTPVNANI